MTRTTLINKIITQIGNGFQYNDLQNQKFINALSDMSMPELLNVHAESQLFKSNRVLYNKTLRGGKGIYLRKQA